MGRRFFNNHRANRTNHRENTVSERTVSGETSSGESSLVESSVSFPPKTEIEKARLSQQLATPIFSRSVKGKTQQFFVSSDGREFVRNDKNIFEPSGRKFSVLTQKQDALAKEGTAWYADDGKSSTWLRCNKQTGSWELFSERSFSKLPKGENFQFQQDKSLVVVGTKKEEQSPSAQDKQQKPGRTPEGIANTPSVGATAIQADKAAGVPNAAVAEQDTGRDNYCKIEIEAVQRKLAAMNALEPKDLARVSVEYQQTDNKGEKYLCRIPCPNQPDQVMEFTFYKHQEVLIAKEMNGNLRISGEKSPTPAVTIGPDDRPRPSTEVNSLKDLPWQTSGRADGRPVLAGLTEHQAIHEKVQERMLKEHLQALGMPKEQLAQVSVKWAGQDMVHSEKRDIYLCQVPSSEDKGRLLPFHIYSYPMRQETIAAVKKTDGKIEFRVGILGELDRPGPQQYRVIRDFVQKAKESQPAVPQPERERDIAENSSGETRQADTAASSTSQERAPVKSAEYIRAERAELARRQEIEKKVEAKRQQLFAQLKEFVPGIQVENIKVTFGGEIDGNIKYNCYLPLPEGKKTHLDLRDNEAVFAALEDSRKPESLYLTVIPASDKGHDARVMYFEHNVLIPGIKVDPGTMSRAQDRLADKRSPAEIRAAGRAREEELGKSVREELAALGLDPSNYNLKHVVVEYLGEDFTGPVFKCYVPCRGNKTSAYPFVLRGDPQNEKVLAVKDTEGNPNIIIVSRTSEGPKGQILHVGANILGQPYAPDKELVARCFAEAEKEGTADQVRARALQEAERIQRDLTDSIRQTQDVSPRMKKADPNLVRVEYAGRDLNGPIYRCAVPCPEGKAVTSFQVRGDEKWRAEVDQNYCLQLIASYQTAEDKIAEWSLTFTADDSRAGGYLPTIWPDTYNR